MQETILVDICGTLYNSNTTNDFIEYLNNKLGKNRGLVRFLNSIPMRILSHLSYIILQKDLRRYYLIRTLKGINQKTVQNLACKFYDEFLVSRENIEVFNFIKSLHNPIILVSATIEPVAFAISKNIKTREFISSKLDYDETGCLTGHLKEDILGKKLEKLMTNGYSPHFSYTISNDFSDLPLFKHSTNCIIVTRKKHYFQWKNLSKSENLNNVKFICSD